MTHRLSRPRADVVVGVLAAVALGAAGCSTEKAAAGGSEEALQNAFTASEAALRKLEKLPVDGRWPRRTSSPRSISSSTTP